MHFHLSNSVKLDQLVYYAIGYDRYERSRNLDHLKILKNVSVLWMKQSAYWVLGVASKWMAQGRYLDEGWNRV